MKKILIIDDSALMRRVMSDIINTDSEMCVTDTAENGVAAAELLKQGKEYELILLDINMPRMDGLSFLKYLNEKEINGEKIFTIMKYTLPDYKPKEIVIKISII